MKFNVNSRKRTEYAEHGKTFTSALNSANNFLPYSVVDLHFCRARRWTKAQRAHN